MSRVINYRMIPEHMRDAMQRYIEHGQHPGSFLTAVLSNDLMGSYANADDINVRAIHAYVFFLYNEAPAGCHSSPENFDRWCEHRGLEFSTRVVDLFQQVQVFEDIPEDATPEPDMLDYNCAVEDISGRSDEQPAND